MMTHVNTETKKLTFSRCNGSLSQVSSAATFVEVRRTTIVITRPKRRKILEPNPIFVMPKIK